MHGSLRWRLALAIGLPAALLAGLLVYVVLLSDRIAQAAERIARDDEAAALALQLGAAVRDQYSHVAHVLLLPRDVEAEHVAHFEHAAARLERTRSELAARAGADPVATALLGQIERQAAAFTALFRDEILPAHRRGDRARALARHVESERLLETLLGLADRLAARFHEGAAARREQARVAAGEAASFAVVTAAVAILLAVGLGAALWRSIAAPLEALERGIARIGAGDLAVEIGPIGDTELGRIARGVDAMTARLRERERALLRAERVGAIGRLAAGLAHQLNNPLGVMLGFARVLCDPRFGERERERAGAALIEEIETCRDTVRGLMTLVRPGAVAREPHELEPLLERAVAAALRYVDGKEVAIERRIEPDLRLETDATKFVQALRNVVTNAIEASEPGGRVVLEAARVGQEVCVAVEDEGPGVPEAERERIFEPYHTGKTSGTGLGLALARGLLEAMGGRLVCAPARCGARFELWLPVDEGVEQREGQG